MTDTKTDRETQLVNALRGAYALRAKAYGHMFDVLRERYGTETALALGREATYRLGTEMGAPFRPHAPADLKGLCKTFLGRIPEPDALFGPRIEKQGDDELVIFFTRCPLKEAWMAAGRSEEDVRLLCEMASAIDQGLFDSAGFSFKPETWKPGREGCCRLVVKPGPK